MVRSKNQKNLEVGGNSELGSRLRRMSDLQNIWPRYFFNCICCLELNFKLKFNVTLMRQQRGKAYTITENRGHLTLRYISKMKFVTLPKPCCSVHGKLYTTTFLRKNKTAAQRAEIPSETGTW